MISGLDHVVVAVRSLDDAVSAFDAIGIAVEVGGRHEGKGTRNALVALRSCYLELLEVEDREVALRSGPTRADLVAFLDAWVAGPVGYAVRSDDLEGDVTRLREAGIRVSDPLAATRRRPDGTVLRWATATIEDRTVRVPWPFLIQWQPGSQPVSVPAEHPAGVTDLRGMTLVCDDLDATSRLYSHLLGAEPQALEDDDEPTTLGRSFSVGETACHLLAPRTPGIGHVAAELGQRGPGPSRLCLGVASGAAIRERVSVGGLWSDGAITRAVRLDLGSPYLDCLELCLGSDPAA